MRIRNLKLQFSWMDIKLAAHYDFSYLRAKYGFIPARKRRWPGLEGV